jgi:hypothetical protein
LVTLIACEIVTSRRLTKISGTHPRGQPLDAANSNIAAWFARVDQRPSVKA